MYITLAITAMILGIAGIVVGTTVPVGLAIGKVTAISPLPVILWQIVVAVVRVLPILPWSPNRQTRRCPLDIRLPYRGVRLPVQATPAVPWRL